MAKIKIKFFLVRLHGSQQFKGGQNPIAIADLSWNFENVSWKAKWSISAKKQIILSYIGVRHDSKAALQVLLKNLMLTQVQLSSGKTAEHGSSNLTVIKISS